MDTEIYQSILDAQARGLPAALAVVVETRGSIPRHTGAKMLVHFDGTIQGSVGGGKFESLVIQDAIACMGSGSTLTKTYPLHEASDASFGAICGGEVMVFLEPVLPQPRLFIFGAGHCGLALAKLAQHLSWHIVVIDDRPDIFTTFTYPPGIEQVSAAGPAFIREIQWRATDAAIFVKICFTSCWWPMS
jgi:xanthine dehydrogenase accessory factor